MATETILQASDVNSNKEENASVLNLLTCKCPRCRKGNMFNDGNPWHIKNTMKMNKTCPVCDQPLDIEPGFYFGAGYVSYALTVAISAVTFVLWWKLVGFANENMLLYWLVSNAVFMLCLQPYLMRVSRTGWLAFFVRYDKNWKINPPKKLERTNKEQENNW
ncbi:MAG: DUF983 domain-containing protein [Chitinophagaceae bacterium]